MSGELDHVAALRAEVEGLRSLVGQADLEAPVPALGRWRVRDVIAHLGGVHRWATRVVGERSIAGPGFKKSKLVGDELVSWFREGLDPLIEALDVDPLESCPNFNPGSPSTMDFWQRRQLHETTVHRWDIERGAGVDGRLDTTVASDAVDEFLDVFVRTRGKQTLSGPLALLATDTGDRWLLVPDPERPGRVHVEPGGGGPTTLSGPADRLLLHCWGRLGLGEAALDVSGDAGVAESFRPG